MKKIIVKVSAKDSTIADIYKRFDQKEKRSNPGKFIKKYVRRNGWQPKIDGPHSGFK